MREFLKDTVVTGGDTNWESQKDRNIIATIIRGKYEEVYHDLTFNMGLVGRSMMQTEG